MEEKKDRRKKSSGISLIGIVFIIISSIGIALILWGVFIWITTRDTTWRMGSMIYGIMLWMFGGILFLTGIGLWGTRKEYTKKSPEEKKDYMNLDWLKHQHYDLGRTIQDIADEQNVSMIVIRKWLDKLENSSNKTS